MPAPGRTPPPLRIVQGGAARPAEDADLRRLRAMMGRFATGVTVIAARHGPLLAGMTANAVASLSVEPPLMMASISRRAETHVAIVGSHAFAISVLSAEQRALAECFALPTTADKLKGFCGAGWHEAESGSPILEGALAYFDCRLAARHPAGDHTLFVGEVAAAGYRDDTEPLLWFGSRYRRLAPDGP